MAEPALVGECIAAMLGAVSVPVTAKTRIGIDESDSYAELRDFVATLAAAGCRTFIVHARKAWLQGLSPRENREIPPLRYDLVHRLKADFPELTVVLNGGIASLAAAEQHLRDLDGVMIGRAAYHDPWMLAEADRRIFGDPHPLPNRHQVVERFLAFSERELSSGAPLTQLTRHLLGLFHGAPGAKSWRRHLSENAHRPGAGTRVIRDALERVPRGR